MYFPDRPNGAVRFAYTEDRPHRLELVRPVAGMLWVAPGAGHPHHLGYWCDDVAGTSAELVKRGLPVCAIVRLTSNHRD